jgi:hypothetical protein
MWKFNIWPIYLNFLKIKKYNTRILQRKERRISQEADIHPRLVQTKNWSCTLWFLNMSTSHPSERWIMFYFGRHINTFWNALHKMLINFFSPSQHQWKPYHFNWNNFFFLKKTHQISVESLHLPCFTFQTLPSNPYFSTLQSI